MNNQVKATYLFPNGMVVTYDWNDNQIEELQGIYSRSLHIRILEASTVLTLFKGFPLISMHEPTFSRTEALSFLELCHSDAEIHQLQELISSQRDRYDYADLSEILKAINTRSINLSIGRALSKHVGFRLPDHLFLHGTNL